MKTLGLTLGAIALLAALSGCGGTEATTSAETYADCVEGITMDPNDVQAYIDEVDQECGHLEGADD